MKSAKTILLITGASILFTIAAPKIPFAADLVVNPADPACSSPGCFNTIQEAIDYANSVVTADTTTTVSYAILVEPGTYTETITLKPGISSVHGRETARTILNGGGNATIITAANMTSSISIRNFTFINAAVGIQVSGNSAVNITNNVFAVGTSGTGVLIQGSPAAEIINNTFFQNATAVVRDSDTVQITNNIFSNNTTANISQSASMTQNNITYNDFNPTPLTTDAIGSYSIPNLPNLTSPVPDPLFVDSNSSHPDMHLKEGSPCIDSGDPNRTDTINGTQSDMGAYGGPNADTIPFPIPQPTAAVTATDATISWAPNNSYLVTNSTGTQGIYNVYYSIGISGAPYQNKISVSSTETSTVISGLMLTLSPPPVPDLISSDPLAGALKLTWTPSAGATGYNVHWGITSPSENTVDVGSNTSYTLSDLTNGQTYQIAVSAYTNATYYFSVTAVDNTGGTATPGIAHESAYSPEAAVGVGTPAESVNSNVITDFPEALVPYPNLPNSDQRCFIATAAFGYYSEPNVQALRNFRDRFLITNRPGKAFVEWYYTHGPVAANWLNLHPEFKPLVRAALMPAIGMSLFMTRTSLFVKILAIFVLGILAIAIVSRLQRKRVSTSGGPH